MLKEVHQFANPEKFSLNSARPRMGISGEERFEPVSKASEWEVFKGSGTKTNRTLAPLRAPSHRSHAFETHAPRRSCWSAKMILLTSQILHVLNLNMSIRSIPYQLSNSHGGPRQNFSLQYQYNIRQTSDENKEKYKSGDYQLIQYQILQTNIIRFVWQTVKRVTNDILVFMISSLLTLLFLLPDSTIVSSSSSLQMK